MNKILRQQILERDGYKCRQCGSTKNLRVHHRDYEEPVTTDKLYTFCSSCHQKLTYLKKKLYPDLKRPGAPEAEANLRRKIRMSGSTFETTMPKHFVEKLARHHNMSVSEFIKNFKAVANFGRSIEGILYTFEPIDGN